MIISLIFFHQLHQVESNAKSAQEDNEFLRTKN